MAKLQITKKGMCINTTKIISANKFTQKEEPENPNSKSTYKVCFTMDNKETFFSDAYETEKESDNLIDKAFE